MAKLRCSDLRRRRLARIHILQGDLALDRESYQNLLFRLTGVRSAKYLDTCKLLDVIDYMQHQLPTKKHYPGRPHNCDDNPQLGKIEALLAHNKLPWSYADSIAINMYGIDRVAFCGGDQLTGVITALIKQYGDTDKNIGGRK